MSIKVIPFEGFSHFRSQDCIVLRRNTTIGDNGETIEVSFPFHEDTPNFTLSMREAMELRNSIDQLFDIKLITHGGNE